MGAECGSFAALPYLRTRPPWVLEQRSSAGGERQASHRVSVTFLKRATTGANTLPSGHAAGSLAVALAVAGALPLVGVVLLVLALTVSLAAIVARAHYVVDVVTGLALAIVIWGIISIVGI
jgi:membrane-associated phospholipid phosphatase